MTLTTPAPVEAPTLRRHPAAGQTCLRRLGSSATGLQCTLDEGHPPGCVFHSTSGVPDAHFKSSGE